MRSNAVELNHVSLRRVTNVLVNTEGRDVGGVAADVSKAVESCGPTGRSPSGAR